MNAAERLAQRAKVERAVAELTVWCDGPRNGVQPCDVLARLRAALEGGRAC